MSEDLVKRLRDKSNIFYEYVPWHVFDNKDFLDKAADRIEELEADLRKTALDYLAADWQAEEAYKAQLAAEARIEELEKENFILAATQCPFPDGEGLTGSPSGHAYCAKDAELEGCDEYIQSLIKTIEEADEQIEELETKLEKAEKIGFDECSSRYGITSYDDWWQDRYKSPSRTQRREIMDSKTQAKLDLAVQRYVEALDLDSICELAQDNLRRYYQNCPTNAEMQRFIDEMEVTDASIKGKKQ